MDAKELRALQAPLKQKYKDDPPSANITMKALGRVGEGTNCRVESGQKPVVAGLHPAAGGTGEEACSGDMLLEALVACAGVTLGSVATAMGITIRDASVRAEGEVDFRGTLGVSKDVPVGFREIRLHYELDTDAGEKQLATLLRLTERYCVVFQTLQNAVNIKVSYEG